MGMARAILICLTLMLVLAPVAEAAKRRVPQGFHGVMYDRDAAAAPADVQDRQFALMARSGVESVRVVFPWAEAQPTAGEQPNFSRLDALVAAA